MRAFFFLLLLFSFGAAAAQETVIEFTDHPARVVTNINGLNMRSSPGIEADNIVGRLQPGQQVHVLAQDGDWQQVRGAMPRLDRLDDQLTHVQFPAAMGCLPARMASR